MNENMGMMLAIIASEAGAVAVSGEALSVGQIVGYIAAILVGGAAGYKVLPILLARLAVSLAGARSERDAIERLEGQLEVERKAAADARQAANDAYRERNDILRELGDVKAELAGLTERANAQAHTIERQNQLISELTKEVHQLREIVRAKNG